MKYEQNIKKLKNQHIFTSNYLKKPLRIEQILHCRDTQTNCPMGGGAINIFLSREDRSYHRLSDPVGAGPNSSTPPPLCTPVECRQTVIQVTVIHISLVILNAQKRHDHIWKLKMARIGL